MYRIQSINKNPGTYVLLARSIEQGPIQIGQRGILHLKIGWYVYVGSAFGPGGLAARVGRHLQHDKTQRWHIDYLRAQVEITEVWLSESQQHPEHLWASYFLLEKDFSVPLPRFGASDCRCAAHLFYSAHKPDREQFNMHFTDYTCSYFLV